MDRIRPRSTARPGESSATSVYSICYAGPRRRFDAIQPNDAAGHRQSLPCGSRPTSRGGSRLGKRKLQPSEWVLADLPEIPPTTRLPATCRERLPRVIGRGRPATEPVGTLAAILEHERPRVIMPTVDPARIDSLTGSRSTIISCYSSRGGIHDERARLRWRHRPATAAAAGISPTTNPMRVVHETCGMERMQPGIPSSEATAVSRKFPAQLLDSLHVAVSSRHSGPGTRQPPRRLCATATLVTIAMSGSQLRACPLARTAHRRPGSTSGASDHPGGFNRVSRSLPVL